MADNTLSPPSSFADPARIAEMINNVARNRARFEKGDGSGYLAFKWGCELLIEVVGLDVLKAIYADDPPDDAEPKEHLIAVARRMMLAEQIFPLVDRKARSSLTVMRREIEAIAHGDKPRLLERQPGGVSGRDSNAYQLAFHQLTALEWEAHLRHLGWPPGRAQAAVGGAYGTAWTNIKRWKNRVVAELGQEAFDRRMADVERGCATFSIYEGVDLIDRLEECGKAYLREEGYRQ